MMRVYIIKRKSDGKIESVPRHLHQAAKVLYGYGDASFADGTPFTELAIEEKMAKAASLEVNYADGTVLVLEHHAVEG